MKVRRYFAALAVPVALGSVALAAGTAHATTTTTLTTHVLNRADSGDGGGTWAYDDFTRTLTVVADPSLNSGTEVGYDATVTDKGTFTTVVGAASPNSSSTAKISHAVKGTFSGSITYKVTATSGDELVASGGTPTENDNFGTATLSTADWPELAFTNPAGVTSTEDNDWSWTYETAAEKWVDSFANGGGDETTAGNITGLVAKPKPVEVPKLSHGQAQYWEPTREQVKYTVSDATAAIAAGDRFEFTIVGPNFAGQHGFVPVTAGTNTAYYEGLAAGHSYTVFYTLVGPNSTTPIAGSVNGHVREGNPSTILPYEGYVFFVSNTHYGS